MPRTELGPAICNRSRWNPADGHSPITERDRPDARFINSISKPPRKGKQTIGKATGIARSNLEPGKSAFDGKTIFNAATPAICEGAICGGDASAKITGAPTSFEYLNGRARKKLKLVLATVTVTPSCLSRLSVNAVVKLKLLRPKKINRSGRVFLRHVLLMRHNGRLLRHIFRGWFGQSYQWRGAGCFLLLGYSD